MQFLVWVDVDFISLKYPWFRRVGSDVDNSQEPGRRLTLIIDQGPTSIINKVSHVLMYVRTVP